MDEAARGAAVLSTDPLLAISHYTKALIQHPTSPDYYVQRSIAFTRLKDPLSPRYDLALGDAELAVLLAQKRAKREKIQAAQQRRVVALFGLQRYGDAAMVLESMVKWRGKDNRKDQMEGDMWKQKIAQRTHQLDPDDERLNVTSQEYPAMDLPSDDELKHILQGELDSDGTYKFDLTTPQLQIDTSLQSDESLAVPKTPGGTIIGNVTEITSDGADDESETIPPKSIKVERSASIVHSPFSVSPMTPGDMPARSLSQGESSRTQSSIRHEWYQNPQTVYVTIYAKGVPKDKTDIEILDHSIFVSFPHPANPSTAYTFSLDPLFAPIDSASSKSSILSTKVELVLSKKTKGQKWASLERTEADAGKETISTSTFSDTKTQVASGPAYPTSSKSGPKDWDKLASDLSAKGKAKKTKKSEKKGKQEKTEGGDDEDSGIDSDYGGDPVDGFFKKIYAGADDDTRRAMMKSFQESGGTALSTNWDEVGKGRVKPVEPNDD